LLQKARRLYLERENLPLPISKESAGITRRSFVKGMTILGGAGIAASAFPITMQALAAIGGKAPRIAIIGGGIAGLNAAYTLKKAGFPAQIYEASSRIGGRIMSRPDAVGNALVIDLGAE